MQKTCFPGPPCKLRPWSRLSGFLCTTWAMQHILVRPPQSSSVTITLHMKAPSAPSAPSAPARAVSYSLQIRSSSFSTNAKATVNQRSSGVRSLISRSPFFVWRSSLPSPSCFFSLRNSQNEPLTFPSLPTLSQPQLSEHCCRI